MRIALLETGQFLERLLELFVQVGELFALVEVEVMWEVRVVRVVWEVEVVWEGDTVSCQRGCSSRWQHYGLWTMDYGLRSKTYDL
jgi:hypothetical protein